MQNALAEIGVKQQAGVALISGEAGIGKSRLIAEFRGAVETEGLSVFQGNCLTYARQTPLWVVAQIVRDIIGLAESVSPEIQRDVLEDYLAKHQLPHLDILPYLLYVLNLPQRETEIEERLLQMESDVLQRQTHAALRQLFLTTTQSEQAVMIFEDLHWIDTASREFLEYLTQTTTDVPLLLVFVARRFKDEPTLSSLVTTIKNNSGYLIKLELQALSITEGQLLANNLISQTNSEADNLKQRIIARAEGNPLYIEEIIRMLIDRGGLVRDRTNGSWQITPEANNLLKSIPGNVKGLILAKFDRLPEGLRRILQKAAVLGDAFSINLLQSLFDTRPEAFKLQIDQLENRQFLTAIQFRLEPGYMLNTLCCKKPFIVHC